MQYSRAATGGCSRISLLPLDCRKWEKKRDIIIIIMTTMLKHLLSGPF